MVILTPNEARTYEGFKQGLLPKEIAAQMAMNVESIRNYMIYLYRQEMIVKHNNKKYSTYTTQDIPYVVGKREPVQEILEIPRMDRPDLLLEEAFGITLTDDQRFYLENHKKKQPRKVLCKRTGLTRLQLNFALERMI